jgi:hypothetical protein
MSEISSNTESKICVIVCTPDAPYTDVVQVSPPHPYWTNTTGGTVVQMNMVTLGGDGLNS